MKTKTLRVAYDDTADNVIERISNFVMGSSVEIEKQESDGELDIWKVKVLDSDITEKDKLIRKLKKVLKYEVIGRSVFARKATGYSGSFDKAEQEKQWREFCKNHGI